MPNPLRYSVEKTVTRKKKEDEIWIIFGQLQNDSDMTICTLVDMCVLIRSCTIESSYGVEQYNDTSI